MTVVNMSVASGQRRSDGSGESLGRKLRKSVLRWFAASGRDFPWRGTCNPFHILIAEALLRQTQAERVVEPYLELIARHPDPWSLARADVRELRRWFKPLGLLRRADRLVQTARALVRDHDGQVPNNLEALLALPGLGTYSARAVLCLGFGAPVPMIDEGSGRVLRRALGLATRRPAYSDRQLLQIGAEILPKKSSKSFNFGLLDIAAAYCRPEHPRCNDCPLLRICDYAQRQLAHGRG